MQRACFLACYDRDHVYAAYSEKCPGQAIRTAKSRRMAQRSFWQFVCVCVCWFLNRAASQVRGYALAVAGALQTVLVLPLLSSVNWCNPYGHHCE